MHIREVELTDAEKLAKLMLKVDEDSKFMLWSSGKEKLV